VDAAFTEIPDPMLSKLKSLPLDYTFIMMKAHIVRNYLAPTLLRAMNTVCPATLASEIMGASTYHLNISVIGNTVKICTWVVEATVERTVYSQHPIAIYAGSKVLFTIEMFGCSYFPSPPPSLRSGQPPLLSLQMALVVALSFFLYCSRCFVICI
jgi:hypothetical protein